jgi:uncharacterized protein YecE (DUF72 family)
MASKIWQQQRKIILVAFQNTAKGNQMTEALYVIRLRRKETDLPEKKTVRHNLFVRLFLTGVSSSLTIHR